MRNNDVKNTKGCKKKERKNGKLLRKENRGKKKEKQNNKRKDVEECRKEKVEKMTE